MCCSDQSLQSSLGQKSHWKHWVFVWVSSSKFVPQTQFGGENARAAKFPFLTEGKNVTLRKIKPCHLIFPHWVLAVLTGVGNIMQCTLSLSELSPVTSPPGLAPYELRVLMLLPYEWDLLGSTSTWASMWFGISGAVGKKCHNQIKHFYSFPEVCSKVSPVVAVHGASEVAWGWSALVLEGMSHLHWTLWLGSLLDGCKYVYEPQSRPVKHSPIASVAKTMCSWRYCQETLFPRLGACKAKLSFWHTK